MGCGMSRYGMAGNLGFDPIRKKLLNMGKGDPPTATVDDTPSTKLLLREAEERAVSNGDNSRKSTSSPHEKAPKDPPLEHKESLKVAKGDGKEKRNGGEGKQNEVKAKNEEVVVAERGGDKDNDGGGEESDCDDGAALSWIHSPSFREYCTHDSDSESDDGFKDGGDGSSDGEKKEMKVEGDKSKSSANSNEGAAIKPKRKGSKGRRSFRTVFPMGKPSAMKNLLQVTSCYNPSAASAARDQKVAKQNEKTV